MKFLLEQTDSRWGTTYYDVLTEPAQYSAFNKSDSNRKFVEDPLHDNKAANKRAWLNCYAIAEEVLAGGVDDSSEGANHYYSEFIDPPSWTKVEEARFIKKIDNTLFYYLEK